MLITCMYIYFSIILWFNIFFASFIINYFIYQRHIYVLKTISRASHLRICFHSVFHWGKRFIYLLCSTILFVLLNETPNVLGPDVAEGNCVTWYDLFLHWFYLRPKLFTSEKSCDQFAIVHHQDERFTLFVSFLCQLSLTQLNDLFLINPAPDKNRIFLQKLNNNQPDKILKSRKIFLKNFLIEIRPKSIWKIQLSIENALRIWLN